MSGKSESVVGHCDLCGDDTEVTAEFTKPETGESVTRSFCERHYQSFTAWWMSMGPVSNPEATELVKEAIQEAGENVR